MKKNYLPPIIAFAVAIAIFSIGGFITPDRSFSETENRNLTKAPKASVNSIINGTFESETESYLSDQLIFRDLAVSTYSKLLSFMGNTDINGVYLGDEGYMFTKTPLSSFDNAELERKLDIINTFGNDIKEYCSGTLSFLLAPTASSIYPELLPDYAKVISANELLAKSSSALTSYKVIDITKSLKDNKNNYLYYKTDHHWTTNGAFIGYEEYCKALGYSYISKDSYDIKTVTNSFLGTHHSKVLNDGYKGESIVVYNSEYQKDAIMYPQGEKTTGIYQEDALDTKDKYTYFLGKNTGLCEIEGKGDKGCAVVIKDSYANCFVPFMLEQYEKLYVIDLRYYGGNVKEVIVNAKPSDLLFLYNCETFASDKNFIKLLR